MKEEAPKVMNPTMFLDAAAELDPNERHEFKELLVANKMVDREHQVYFISGD